MQLLGIVKKPEYSDGVFIVQISQGELAEIAGFYSASSKEISEFLKNVGNTLDVTPMYENAKAVLNAYEELTCELNKKVRALEVLGKKLEESKMKHLSKK